MDYMILCIVSCVSIVQSIFGVGILLFGTPLLLLYGCGFEKALGILLPISIVINSFQIASNYRLIDRKLLTRFFIYCMPFIVFSLLFVLQVKLNLSLMVGILLILSSASMFMKNTLIKLQLATKHERIYLATMGIVHGVSNLGGSLLALFMLSKFTKKSTIRVNIATIYVCFALVQILALFIGGVSIDISYVYLEVGIVAYIFSTTLLDGRLSDIGYEKAFAIFLLLVGASLIGKN